MTKSPHRLAAILAASVLALAQCSRPGTGLPPGPPSLDRVTVSRFGMFSYGASGVATLPDGRILIAEDEKLHPLVIVDLFGSGRTKEFTPADVVAAFGAGVAYLNDLEGITIDPRGHLYATSSHAVPRDGIQTPDRMLVVRFDVAGDSLTHALATSSLDGALATLDATIAGSIGRNPKTRWASPGLNIEGIAWDPRTSHLLFGLRGPLDKDQAQVVSMDNPDDVFERGATPVLSGPYLLGLEGQGIRDISYDEDLASFLVVAGASGMSAYGHAELWRWAGPGGPPPQKLRAPVLGPLKPEGVTAMTVRDQRLILFVCDDGWLDTKFFNGKARINEGIPSRYAVLPYAILQRDNPSLPRLP